jgi:siroheme synthase-like protein
MGELTIITLTPEGGRLAERLALALGARLERGEAALRDAWAEGAGLALVGPLEGAVRAIAAPLAGGLPAPAVVCLDAAGRLAIPLLEGGPPGAPELARQLAGLCGGRALLGPGAAGQAGPSKSPGRAHSYPVSLTRVAGALAVVVGGGPVGERKARGLIAVGAAVRLVSPDATDALREWAAAGQLRWEARPYTPGDLEGARLAFAATDSRAVNAAVAEEAAHLGVLCNIADDPAGSDFHLPAIHRQGDLTVAVSTEGGSPARAARTRDQIAAWLQQDEV